MNRFLNALIARARFTGRGAVIAAAFAGLLWLLAASPVSAGERLPNGDNAYWEVDTTIKTDKPAYISVNIKASYHVRKNVVVDCKEGDLPGEDGLCHEKKWVEQDDMPRINPKTEMTDAYPTELWQPGGGRPQPNPNIGIDVPRLPCTTGGEARIKMRWEVSFRGTTIDTFWSGDCPGQQTQLCDVHENFNGLLVGREQDYCPTPLIDELQRTFPYPTISLGVNPPRGLVAEPTWLWIEGYGGESILHSACLPRAPICAAVKVSPRADELPYIWTVGVPGDIQVETDLLGEAYPAESPVQYTFERDSSRVPEGYYPISLAITWDVSWHLATQRRGAVEGIGHPTGLPRQTRQYPGGPEPGGGWLNAPLRYEVIEVRSVLVR
jgi:hypothetical protein